MATPQAFSSVQNLWAAQNGQGNVANVLPVAMQLAANGDALALAQALGRTLVLPPRLHRLTWFMDRAGSTCRLVGRLR